VHECFTLSHFGCFDEVVVVVNVMFKAVMFFS